MSTVSFLSHSRVYIQESSARRFFSMNLDSRELGWVERATTEIIGRPQWVRRSFRGDSGNLIFQTLENHLGKLLRIWRVGSRGWDTILITYDNGRGWGMFLNGLVEDEDSHPSTFTTSRLHHGYHAPTRADLLDREQGEARKGPQAYLTTRRTSDAPKYGHRWARENQGDTVKAMRAQRQLQVTDLERNRRQTLKKPGTRRCSSSGSHGAVHGRSLTNGWQIPCGAGSARLRVGRLTGDGLQWRAMQMDISGRYDADKVARPTFGGAGTPYMDATNDGDEDTTLIAKDLRPRTFETFRFHGEGKELSEGVGLGLEIQRNQSESLDSLMQEEDDPDGDSERSKEEQRFQ
ncbi:hypothetical protein Scep_007810 [Stephania cephalantha]|uniref:Uncharacterized protein n=1 Tax=Stephania cephalantha TaxID=152367 RepID=A0AAP0KAJ4_9MAGN